MKCATCGGNHLIVRELMETLGKLEPTDELSKNLVGNLLVMRVTNYATDEYENIGFIDLHRGTFEEFELVRSSPSRESLE
jgi:hypothetical protein